MNLDDILKVIDIAKKDKPWADKDCEAYGYIEHIKVPVDCKQSPFDYHMQYRAVYLKLREII